MTHRFHRQQKGLLKQILAAHRGVRGLIGKADPGTAGGKVDLLLHPLSLVLRGAFHRIVQGQHQMIVMATPTFGDPQRCQQPGA